MFITKYTNYIQKNIKTIAILAVSGFLLGLAFGRSISPVETKVERISVDKNFKTQSIESSSLDKSNPD
jgi:hypothetical protein